MLTQPKFPPHRQRDPLRLAELQVYTEIMNSDREGRALYELTSANAPQLDFAVAVQDVAIFGLQVKGGRHIINRGEFQLITADGPENIPCPLKVTWDAAMQIRDPVSKRLGRKAFVVPVLVFPDMEPDPDIELRAEHDPVKVLFGAHNLVERLVDLVADQEIFSPPTAWQLDEIAETLMPFLVASGPSADEPEDQESEGQAGDVSVTDVGGRPIVVHHADVVNMYHAPVTINNYHAAVTINNYRVAPEAEDSAGDADGAEEALTE